MLQKRLFSWRHQGLSGTDLEIEIDFFSLRSKATQFPNQYQLGPDFTIKSVFFSVIGGEVKFYQIGPKQDLIFCGLKAYL